MGYLFEFLAGATKTATGDINIGMCDDNTLFIFQIARLVIRIIQIAVPFVLIIWGSLDFFKAVIAGDEKEMKQKRKPFVSRLIAAIIVLLLPTLVNVIMKALASSSQSRFATCWDAASSGANGSINLPENNDNFSD